MELRHHGETVRVTAAAPVTVPVPQTHEQAPAPEQPPGRAPLLRLPESRA